MFYQMIKYEISFWYPSSLQTTFASARSQESSQTGDPPIRTLPLNKMHRVNKIEGPNHEEGSGVKGMKVEETA